MDINDQVPMLYAPRSFVEASDEMRAAVCNGCGPGGWKEPLVPDTVWGLDISPACNIHDWMYTEGDTHAQKVEADRVFLYNMQRIVDYHTRWGYLRALRRRRVLTYYQAVANFGGPYFWKGKNLCTNGVFSSAAAVKRPEKRS